MFDENAMEFPVSTGYCKFDKRFFLVNLLTRIIKNQQTVFQVIQTFLGEAVDILCKSKKFSRWVDKMLYVRTSNE